jgi:hypothetical protein
MDLRTSAGKIKHFGFSSGFELEAGNPGLPCYTRGTCLAGNEISMKRKPSCRIDPVASCESHIQLGLKLCFNTALSRGNSSLCCLNWLKVMFYLLQWKDP